MRPLRRTSSPLQHAVSLRGRAAAALSALWRAHECGERHNLDPRATIVDLLLSEGEQDEAQSVSEQIRKSRPQDGRTYHNLADVWDDQGETQRALGSLMRGIMLHERQGLPEHVLRMLCLARWRIRDREGQDPDDCDVLALDLQERLSQRANS